jgi:hypothetical protein
MIESVPDSKGAREGEMKKVTKTKQLRSNPVKKNQTAILYRCDRCTTFRYKTHKVTTSDDGDKYIELTCRCGTPKIVSIEYESRITELWENRKNALGEAVQFTKGSRFRRLKNFRKRKGLLDKSSDEMMEWFKVQMKRGDLSINEKENLLLYYSFISQSLDKLVALAKHKTDVMKSSVPPAGLLKGVCNPDLPVIDVGVDLTANDEDIMGCVQEIVIDQRNKVPRIKVRGKSSYKTAKLRHRSKAKILLLIIYNALKHKMGDKAPSIYALLNLIKMIPTSHRYIDEVLKEVKKDPPTSKDIAKLFEPPTHKYKVNADKVPHLMFENESVREQVDENLRKDQ